MAAATGTAVFPGASTFPNTSGINPGQGTLPIFRCLVSFDDASIGELRIWTDETTRLRSFDITRGRTSELSEFDTGSATIVLDNRDRVLDPNVTASVRPLNKVWFYEEFSGERQSLFVGYVTAWQQAWDPSGIVDATATITASDELLVLSQAALPTTNPPRETYADLINADSPVGYWDMNEDPGLRQRLATTVEGEQPPAAGSSASAGARTATVAQPLRGDRRRFAYPAARRKN